MAMNRKRQDPDEPERRKQVYRRDGIPHGPGPDREPPKDKPPRSGFSNGAQKKGPLQGPPKLGGGRTGEKASRGPKGTEPVMGPDRGGRPYGTGTAGRGNGPQAGGSRAPRKPSEKPPKGPVPPRQRGSVPKPRRPKG